MKKTEKGYLEKAVNFAQYDEGEIDWSSYGSEDDPTRKFFKQILREEVKSLQGKSVLDVGSGSGAMFNLFLELGAKKVQGIEPSVKNCSISQKFYPEVPIFKGELFAASFDEKFDVCFAVMVFEHFSDIGAAYQKISSLLVPNGKLFVIFQDMEYLLAPDFHYSIDYENIGEETVAAKIEHSSGDIYDLLRLPEVYIKAAEESGLVIEKYLPMKPTLELIEAAPKYEHLKDRAIRHLLVLRKVEVFPTFDKA